MLAGGYVGATGGEPIGKGLEALVDRHGRLPVEIVANSALIEPVGGSELFGDEAGQWRLVGTVEA